MIDDYKAAGISPRKVFAQSFNKDTSCTGSGISGFGRQAVFLDDAMSRASCPTQRS